MAMDSFNKFNDMHKSVLQEICNMGAGNAATALSQMVSTPTDISTPQVKINPASLAGKVADMMSASAEAYLIKLCGDLKGALMFTFPYPFIERLAGTFFPGISIKSKDDIDEMSGSAVNELVNITAASYANSLALMSGLTVDISVPEHISSPSKEILALNAGIDSLCFVNNSIEIVEDKKTFNVFFYPELQSIQGFMGKIGVEC